MGVSLVFPAWRFYILPTQRSLSTADTMAKARLEKASDLLLEKFLSPEFSEAHLDDIHMQLKMHRRVALKHKLPHIPKEKKLARVRVTAKGITAIEDGEDCLHGRSPSHYQRKGHIREDELVEEKLFHDHISAVSGKAAKTKKHGHS